MEQLSKVFEEVRDEWTNSSGYDKDGKWDLHKTHIFTDEEARNLEDHVYDGIATESDVLDEALRRILCRDIETVDYDWFGNPILGLFWFEDQVYQFDVRKVTKGLTKEQQFDGFPKVTHDAKHIKAMQDALSKKIEGFEPWDSSTIFIGTFPFNDDLYAISADIWDDGGRDIYCLPEDYHRAMEVIPNQPRRLRLSLFLRTKKFDYNELNDVGLRNLIIATS